MAQDQTTKGWRQDVWRNDLTQKVTEIEITPEGDLKSHDSSTNCECIPRLTYEHGVRIVIHNAYDGREIAENHERGH